MDSGYNRIYSKGYNAGKKFGRAEVESLLEHIASLKSEIEHLEDIKERIILEDTHKAIGAAIEHAAGNLDKHHVIEVSIENSGYGVHMDDGGDGFYPDNDSLVDDILECVSQSTGQEQEQ